MIAETQTPPIRRLDIAGNRRAELDEFAERERERFRSNQPFPHLVLDDFFPASVLDDVLAELGDVEHEESRDFFAARNRFLTYDVDRLAPTTQRFLIDLNSAGFCSFLETLTGIDGLISDPSLFGGGFQEMGRGGYLKMHADFSWHERLQLDRRLNLLIYLNRRWRQEWKGELVLGDPPLERFSAIAPRFNRAVIFAVTDSAFHGVPDPIECPEGETRKALALYYYTAGRPAGEVRQRRTESDYRRRPGETFDGAGGLGELPGRLVRRARGAIKGRRRRLGGRSQG